jgi:hypothetical protein
MSIRRTLMEKWEYWTGFLWANIENEGARELIKKRWPDWKNPPKYAPQTMIPALNNFGEQGWELVHMEPVAGVVGVNYDMAFFDKAEWSNAYFCVFKCRKQE